MNKTQVTANLLELSKYSSDVQTFSLTHHDLLYGWLDKAYILQQYNSFLQHMNKHTCNVVQFYSMKKQLLKYECCTLRYNGCIYSMTHRCLAALWLPCTQIPKEQLLKSSDQDRWILYGAWGKYSENSKTSLKNMQIFYC